MANLLITDCLQHDFVAPLGRFDPLPNALHIGYEEARRIMGETPEEGPVARIMNWAYQQQDERLRLLHIRDWHDAEDPHQEEHLAQFGPHCLAGSPGADFVFSVPEAHGKDVAVIDTQTLNNFHGTALQEVLTSIVEEHTRIGLIGVWTEAKITFLAYELRSRFPNNPLAVCSALTASATRHGHFYALDQLERILGVEVIASLGAFSEWLGGEKDQAPLLGFSEGQTKLELSDDFVLKDADRTLLQYLFRDARTARFTVLDGGFSGNVVLSSESEDRERRRQVPHVIKIGPRDAIHHEREAFERIETVLGNAAPRITDFADLQDRAALKYRYASMHGQAQTFQKAYMGGIPMTEVRRILDTVFLEQLGRLYAGAERERCDILEYYGFSSRWQRSVRAHVEAILGKPADGELISILPGMQVPNLCHFYEHSLDRLTKNPGRSWHFATVHGDLNGANIVLDGNHNVWLIDFFHTHRGHVLKDLIKLENDLLYIWTPIEDEEGLREAIAVSEALLKVRDLWQAAPEKAKLPKAISPALRRAVDTLVHLRGYYRELVDTDRDPMQLLVGQLRYAVHTLGFKEASPLQKRWALYMASRLAEVIEQRSRAVERIRVDWLPLAEQGGKVGLTILPGRRDYERDLEADVDALLDQNVTHILTLVGNEELEQYGVPELPERLVQAGLNHLQLPILDQKACGVSQAEEAIAWIQNALGEGGNVVIHCVGGLGRSGMIAACFMIRMGLDANIAIAEVRRARSPRAIETQEQARFVKSFL